MIVVDTSAIVGILTARVPPPRLLERLLDDGDLHAPHLLDVEVLHALRRMTRHGSLTQERAAEARAEFAQLTMTRYEHAPLASRVWELRENVSAYDGMYIALAELLDAAFVTCDSRLAGAQGVTADIELYTLD